MLFCTRCSQSRADSCLLWVRQCCGVVISGTLVFKHFRAAGLDVTASAITACAQRPGAVASVSRRRRERRSLLAGELVATARLHQARPLSACTCFELLGESLGARQGRVLMNACARQRVCVRYDSRLCRCAFAVVCGCFHTTGTRAILAFSVKLF